MPKRKLTRDDLYIIAANFLPVLGVWFLGWNAVEVFIVYALETIIVGAITVLKLLVATLARGKDTWYNEGKSTQVSGFFFIFFFIVHFGLFALVQTSIFSESANVVQPGKGMTHFFFHWWEYTNEGIIIMLCGFVVSYLARSFVPFIISGDYKRMSMMRIMFSPYGRIFIQQFTVILGSMFLTFGWNKGFILVFAAAKTLFEVYFNFEAIMDKSMTEMEKKGS